MTGERCSRKNKETGNSGFDRKEIWKWRGVWDERRHRPKREEEQTEGEMKTSLKTRGTPVNNRGEESIPKKSKQGGVEM